MESYCELGKPQDAYDISNKITRLGIKEDQ